MASYVIRYKGSGKLSVVKEGQIVSKCEDFWLVKPSIKTGRHLWLFVMIREYQSSKEAWEFAKLQHGVASTSEPSKLLIVYYLYLCNIFLLTVSDHHSTPTACKACEIWQAKYEAAQDRIQALQQRVSALNENLLAEKAVVRRVGGKYA